MTFQGGVQDLKHNNVERHRVCPPFHLDKTTLLKFGTLAAGVGCATGPNSGDFSHIVCWNTKAGPCIGSALGAAVVRLIYKA